MKHCCKNCHFLTRLHVFEEEENLKTSFVTWDEDERKSFSPLKDSLLVFCKKGIWYSPSGSRNLPQLESDLTRDRKDDCYFVEYVEKMGFDAADELQRRRYETRQFKRGFRYTQIGLWIAALGLFANLAYQVFADCNICP